jgi:hypothetical protein
MSGVIQKAEAATANIMGRIVIRRTTITAANDSLQYFATRTQVEARSLARTA